MVRLAIGIDVGGTKILGGVVDEKGMVLARARRVTPARDPEQIVRMIVSVVEELRRAAAGPYEGIGLAMPGQFDERSGSFVRIANLALMGFPFRSRLEEALGETVRIENDTNAAALGEWRGGAGDGHAHFIYLALGTGIGAGVIVHGRLLRGAHGAAGEIGHTVVEKDGPQCPCGNRGCLEMFASGGALARRAAELAELRPDSLLAAWKREGRDITASDLFRAADQGDAPSREIVDEAMRYLAVGVNNLIELFDPTAIAIGGGMAQLGDRLLARLAAAIRLQRPGSPDVSGRLAQARRGEDAGLVGAAAIVLQRGDL
jgi:glucokinase